MLTLGPLTDYGSPDLLVFGSDLGMIGPFSGFSPLTWVILHYGDMEIMAILAAGETISYQTANDASVTATMIAATVSANMVTAASESISFITVDDESITSALTANNGEVLQWQTP